MSDVDERLSAMEPTDKDFENDDGRRTEDRAKLVQAVRRLLDGDPHSETLRIMLQEEGRVPITKNTVEIESGVNRRRFSGPASEHPELSTLLKDLKPDHGVGKTTTDRLARQSRVITLLEQQLAASRSATAAQVVRIQALAVKLGRAERRIERIRTGKDEDDG